MTSLKKFFLLFIISISSALLFSGSSFAEPSLDVKFKAQAQCNKEPHVNQSGTTMNWKALDCVFGLLGTTTGFARAHVIAHTNSDTKNNSVDLNWLTHIRGGHHETDIKASAEINLDGEFSLKGVDPKNKDLTFLWIKDRLINLPDSDKDNLITTEADYKLDGAYYGNFDKLTSFEGKTLKGVLGRTSLLKFYFSFKQRHEHIGACCHKAKDGQMQYPYRIISPDTCRHRSHFWTPGYFDKGAIQRLVNIVCVSIGESPDNPKFGKHTYSIIINLEKYSKLPKTYPLSSKVSKIRLQRFWNRAAKTFRSAKISSAKNLRQAGNFFLDRDDPNSLLNLLAETRKHFSSQSKKKRNIEQALTALSDISSSLSSRGSDPTAPHGIGTIMEPLKNSGSLTRHDIDELTIASIAVGNQLRDQADLEELEAEVYEVKSKN